MLLDGATHGFERKQTDGYLDETANHRMKIYQRSATGDVLLAVVSK
jgi:hypothetical protein